MKLTTNQSRAVAEPVVNLAVLNSTVRVMATYLA
jgi:hypothetical protein